MDAYSRASASYGGAQMVASPPRQIEYQAFAKATHALSAAASAEGPDAFSRLAAALNDNMKLWMIIATDIALPENELPKRLRAQLFSLAVFTRGHTKRILAREAGADAAELIEVNSAIMRGLRARAEAEPCPA